MAHFAKIENGTVTQVIVADQEFIDSGILDGRWVQTSYNTHGGVHPEGRPLRKNYAGIGFIYDETRDVFYAPQPFASWILDENTCHWNPPVAYPEDDKIYTWDEDTINWKIVE